jgi:dTDP-4-dehydrorhamnose 3,5-epimerase-like enzyme
VVSDDVPAYAIVAGNPAQVTGYVQETYEQPQTVVVPPRIEGSSIEIAGCTLTRLPEVVDMRGRLTFAEVEQSLPFEPKRMFTVFAVPNSRIRGSHAHYELHELLFCVSGSVKVTLDNGIERGQVLLDNPALLLHLRPMTWTMQYDYSSDAALVVMCSHKYDNDDYIRDYDTFLEIVRG